MAGNRVVAPAVCVAVLTFEMGAHEAILPHQPHVHSEDFSGDSVACPSFAFAASGTATLTMMRPNSKTSLSPAKGLPATQH
jgi:hypothetical protein